MSEKITESKKARINLVWFKRDLRIHDHAPLHLASKSELPVLPLYVVEPEYWRQPFASRRHWHFIFDCLIELNHDLANLGQGLVVKTGNVIDVLDQLKQHYEIETIFAHEETSNGWTYERDKQVITWCKNNDILLNEHPTNGVIRRLRSRDDWSAIRNERMAQDSVPKPKSITPLPSHELELEDIPSKDHQMFGNPIPIVNGSNFTQMGGRRAAIQTLTSFLAERGREYLYSLSAPGASEQFCSRLSPHLVWGTLSVKEVLHSTINRRAKLLAHEKAAWTRNISAFSSRLSWRCHFIQKIEDQPEIEYQCMHPAFEGIRENDFNQDYYEAWASGNTGYPIIDACMRNLVHQGWITFRMRAMLVSFASYQLWLDWRKTGYHLARTFTDYEPGIHYSQLQMQSGVTGINTLRIYNPIKQSQQHDPNGHFIRKWVPELANVSTSWIHEPWLMSNDLQQKACCIIGENYPKPIVDHATSIKEARAKLKIAREDAGFRETADKVYQKLGSRKRQTRVKKEEKADDSQLGLFD